MPCAMRCAATNQHCISFPAGSRSRAEGAARSFVRLGLSRASALPASRCGPSLWHGRQSTRGTRIWTSWTTPCSTSCTTRHASSYHLHSCSTSCASCPPSALRDTSSCRHSRTPRKTRCPDPRATYCCVCAKGMRNGGRFQGLMPEASRRGLQVWCMQDMWCVVSQKHRILLAYVCVPGVWEMCGCKFATEFAVEERGNGTLSRGAVAWDW